MLNEFLKNELIFGKIALVMNANATGTPIISSVGQEIRFIPPLLK